MATGGAVGVGDMYNVVRMLFLVNKMKLLMKYSKPTKVQYYDDLLGVPGANAPQYLSS